MIFSIISSLFGCGSKDSAPGMFSAMGYHIGKTKVWLKSPGSGMQVYVVGELEGADPATFQVDDGAAGKSRDAKHRYDLEKQI